MTASTFRVLSLIPPMTQLNTPYPSSAYLTGFLRERGFAAAQEDLALQLVLRLLCSEGLAHLQAHALARRGCASGRVRAAGAQKCGATG